MEMFTAKVVNGHVDVSEESLPDGAEVIVLVPEDDDSGFTLTDAERAELAEAMEQLRRGEGVDGWELLRDLKS
jgi:phosphopantetheine adenylyltransferase